MAPKTTVTVDGKPTSLFGRVEKEFSRSGLDARSKESMKWFQSNLKDRKIGQNQILTDSALIRVNQIKPGRLYQFSYDPKTAETLPYYDRFPLILAVGPAEGGFYGLNMHYLSPFLRARLFDRLLEYTNNDKFDDTTKFRMSYNILSNVSKLNLFQPCFKHYLTSHVDSRIIMIPPASWEIAVFLPTERFKKQKKDYVWRQSKQSIR
ncbi:MAG: hypothetical protein ACO26H_04325 [Sediminibacterium sp.]